MPIAQITFVPNDPSRDRRDELRDVAEDYLSTLFKTGHLHCQSLVAWSNGSLVAFSKVARPDALAQHFHGAWGFESLEKVIKAFGTPPTVQILDEVATTNDTDWRTSSSLYLFTHALDDTSPLCCGDSGRSIPLYLSPLAEQLREDIYFWSCNYKHVDSLWLGSRVLEISAYKQLADPKSQLSVRGREICRDIEKATGKPTFFYLHRYWARRTGESERPCPMCGQRWHKSDVDDNSSFCQFHFRCDPCRLVSQCGPSDDSGRNARIGEFRE